MITGVDPGPGLKDVRGLAGVTGLPASLHLLLRELWTGAAILMRTFPAIAKAQTFVPDQGTEEMRPTMEGVIVCKW